MNYKNLDIVPVNLIPKGEDCLDNLPELWKLGLYMQEICDKNDGIGLSAVQVGVPLNFFIIKFGDAYRYFVNCRYEPLNQEKAKSIEGCLSIKGNEGKPKLFELDRFKDIRIIGKELLAEPVLVMVNIDLFPVDFFKVVFQHEIDHQNGILISAIGKEIHVWNKK